MLRRLWRQRFSLIGLLIALWLAYHLIVLALHARQPSQALLVLGGSIRREVYATEWVRQHPGLPVLISGGSRPPCIKLIFADQQASMEPVWLENCANSTFDNFVFSAPILQRWGIQTVTLATSARHLPRAIWLGRLMLGAHDIWVNLKIVPEKGVPANQESSVKTALDSIRGLAWAIVSQIYSPSCDRLTHLPDVNLTEWEQKGFHCEHQVDLPDYDQL